MHPVDTRLSGEFELKKDVEPGGDSYLAHILKLETFTNRRPSRVGNGGVWRESSTGSPSPLRTLFVLPSPPPSKLSILL